ncbi:type 1 glutamine amidotransferase [Zavarzinia aquatilis]|nr:type 1 glutamine amidotransferase [Zavarzinia aquatilis]
MRILCVQNDLRTPPGLVGLGMMRAGARLDVIAPHHAWSSLAPRGGIPVPADPGDYDALLVLGGPMHANNDKDFPPLERTAGLIAQFAAQDRPVLGICLGSQLIARAFGARVYPHSLTEVGFRPLDLTAEAAADPLLAGLPAQVHIMQWHEDTFELPQGATLLMTGPECHHQAFRIGRATYAFQCHFEVTGDIARTWVQTQGEWLARNKPDILARFEDDLHRHLPAAARFAATVTERFLTLVR